MASSFKQVILPETKTHWLVQGWYDLRFWFSHDLWFRMPTPIRNSGWSLSRWWHANVTCLLFPRNRWATRVIGRTWQDKPQMIESFLFALVIDFVEAEDCFGTTVWDETEEKTIRLREVYAWAKSGRAQALAQMEGLWSPGPMVDENGEWLGMDSARDTGDIHAYWAAEKAIEERDTELLTWVVTHRAILWT